MNELFAAFIRGFAGEAVRCLLKDIEKQVAEQKEIERSRKLKEGSIDVEYKVIEEK